MNIPFQFSTVFRLILEKCIGDYNKEDLYRDIFDPILASTSEEEVVDPSLPTISKYTNATRRLPKKFVDACLRPGSLELFESTIRRSVLGHIFHPLTLIYSIMKLIRDDTYIKKEQLEVSYFLNYNPTMEKDHSLFLAKALQFSIQINRIEKIPDEKLTPLLSEVAQSAEASSSSTNKKENPTQEDSPSTRKIHCIGHYPPEIRPFFIGRDTELEDIDIYLRQHRVVFLYGQRGIGKSALANTYALSARGSSTIYPNGVIWLTYQNSLRNTIENLSLNITEVFSNTTFEQNLNWLKSLDKSTLVVLDNFDVTEDEEPLFYEFVNCSFTLLITSHFHHESCVEYPLGELSEENLLLIFRNYYTKKEISDEEALLLIRSVHKHTLLVEMTAKLLHNSKRTVAKLIESLNESLLNSPITTNIRVSKDGMMTSNMIRNHLQTLFSMTELSHTEKATLACMAYVPYEGMPAQTFTDWCLQEDYDVIMSLHDHGWITYMDSTDYVSMHPLIADLVKDTLPVFFDQIEVFVTNFVDAERQRHEHFEPAIRDRYIPLALSLSTHVNDFPCQSWYFLQLENVGYIQSCGLLSATEEILCQILRQIEALEFDRHLFCQAAYKLVGVYNQISKYEEADVLMRKIMDKFQRITHGNLPWVILCFLEAAFLYALKGNITVSRSLLQASTEITSEMLQEEAAQMIDHRTLFKLGEVNRIQGDYTAALEAFQSSLNIRTEMYGSDSEEVGLVYAQIGLTYRKMGRNAEAADNLYQSFITLAKIYPDYHSDLLSIQLSLGITLEEISGIDLGVSHMIDYLSGSISFQAYNEKRNTYLQNFRSYENFCAKVIQPQSPAQAKKLKSSGKIIKGLFHRWEMTVGKLSYKESVWLEHKRIHNILPNTGVDVPALLRYNYRDFSHLLRLRPYMSSPSTSDLQLLHLSHSSFYRMRTNVEKMYGPDSDSHISNISLSDFYRYIVDGKDYPLPRSEAFLRFHGLTNKSDDTSKN